jgi:FkbM family methyltransferase
MLWMAIQVRAAVLNYAVHPSYNVYEMKKIPELLVIAAQSMPRNWLGQQLAQIIRKLVMSFTGLPMLCRVDDLTFLFYLHDNNSEKKYLLIPWRFDLTERELLVESMPDDGIFIDVGANVGIYSLYIARRLGRHGRVLSLEPNPAAYNRLVKNIELNSEALNCKPSPLQIGIADQDQLLELYLDKRNLGGSSLVTSGKDSVSVSCQSLLNVLQEENIHRIDGLKIDIEGAEDIALVPFFEKAPKSLYPRLIVIENSRHLWREDLAKLFFDKGYSLKYASRMNSVYTLESC